MPIVHSPLDLLRYPADPDRAPLLHGFAPPKAASTPERVTRITARRSDRIVALDVDGIVVYDVQDESDRIQDDRPFPFLPTLDPFDFSKRLASAADQDLPPRIVYIATAACSRSELLRRLKSIGAGHEAVVLVGASSSRSKPHIKLGEAYELLRYERPDVTFGGVTIPERHVEKGDEHHPLLRKMRSGCEFFISQCVFDSMAAINALSDCLYEARRQVTEMPRIILTFSPCGSLQTRRLCTGSESQSRVGYRTTWNMPTMCSTCLFEQRSRPQRRSCASAPTTASRLDLTSRASPSAKLKSTRLTS